MTEPALTDFMTAMKAVQWEKAKGELRAMAALQGSYITTNRRPDEIASETERFEMLQRRTEEFIGEIESAGLHE